MLPTDAFAPYADTTKMLPLLQKRLDDGTDYTLCTLLDARCRTYLKQTSWDKSSLDASYELEGATATGRRRQVRLFAQVYLGGRAAAAYRDMPDEAKQTQAVAHWEDLDMLVWSFPRDPVLSQLPDVTQAQGVLAHLPDELRSACVGDVQVQMLRYRPAKQCTTRVSVSQPSAGGRTSVLIGKAYRPGKSRAVYERTQQLWQAASAQPEMLRVPRPLGWAEAIETVWMEDVGGQPLWQVLNDANHAHYLDLTAQGLAAVHRCKIACSAMQSVEGLFDEATKKAAKLAVACPVHAAGLERLIERLHRLAGQLEASAPTLAYGDFHLGQVHATGADRVTLLDFDSFVMGDVERDLAEFVVDLRFRGYPPSLARRMSACFVDAYQRHAHRTIDHDRLRWHTTYQYLDKAYHAYLGLVPGLEAHLRDMLHTLTGDADERPAAR